VEETGQASRLSDPQMHPTPDSKSLAGLRTFVSRMIVAMMLVVNVLVLMLQRRVRVRVLVRLGEYQPPR
jgi:hypothetical protein